MKSLVAAGVACALAVSLSPHAAAAPPAPSFDALRAPAVDTTSTTPHASYLKPKVESMPAPNRSVIRMVPGRDGKLHSICEEVENPRHAQAVADRAANGGNVR